MSPGSPPIPLDFSISIDADIYPREVVIRTCYAFADRCHCWVETADDRALTVGFRIKEQPADADTIKGEFADALIDFALRRQIENETRHIRDVLVGAALAEAGGGKA